MTDVGFLIVNEREPVSRAMFWELKRRAPEGIPVYQQGLFQSDVWEILEGEKDDFLIYDRCGLLTFHIVLPYSFLHYPYVEAAIRATYLRDICGNCTLDSSDNQGLNASQIPERKENVTDAECLDDHEQHQGEQSNGPQPSRHSQAHHSGHRLVHGPCRDKGRKRPPSPQNSTLSARQHAHSPHTIHSHHDLHQH
uniref:Selenoprotein Pb-like n=1 Tax=Lepisosteus oculatus TaxID=7918 RepID=W5M4W3_LEPOC